MDERALREELCEVGRRIWQRGLVAANDGNLSVLLADDEILATPTGVSKGFMTPDMMVVLDRAGHKLRGDMEPSSELRMHRAFYDDRPDVRAVCHTHPPTATGFAVAGLSLDRAVLPEVIVNLGAVPLARYGLQGTDELMQDIRERYVDDHDAFLLANHGAVTLGSTLMDAYFKMETVEHFARISLVARQLGTENVLPPARVQELLDARARYGATARGTCRIEAGLGVSYAPDVREPSAPREEPMLRLGRVLTVAAGTRELTVQPLNEHLAAVGEPVLARTEMELDAGDVVLFTASRKPGGLPTIIAVVESVRLLAREDIGPNRVA